MSKRNGRFIISANIILILINIIYFVIIELLGSSDNTSTMLRLGAMYNPYILENKEYYRLLSSIFMHFGINHLANNMLILYLLGDSLEKSIGSIKYFLLFIISGTLANVASMFWDLNSKSISAGASGAVFAVMGALLFCLIKKRGRLNNLSFGQIAIALALSTYYGLTSANVDNVAHIAGAFIGFILAILLYRG